MCIYSCMFIPDRSGHPLGSPCPNRTSIIDALAGEVRLITQRIDPAVSAKAPIEQVRRLGEQRGWGLVRLLSAATSMYNRVSRRRRRGRSVADGPCSLYVAAGRFITSG